MQQLIDSLKQAIPDGLEEIQTLARTLISRSQDVLAYFDHPRTSNGPTPTDAWSTYVASPWGSATSPTTPSAASSTPDVSKTT